MAQWTVVRGWSVAVGPAMTSVLVTVRYGRRTLLAVSKPAAGNAANFCPSPGAVVEKEELRLELILTINTIDTFYRI